MANKKEKIEYLKTQAKILENKIEADIKEFEKKHGVTILPILESRKITITVIADSGTW